MNSDSDTVRLGKWLGLLGFLLAGGAVIIGGFFFARWIGDWLLSLQ